MDRSRYRFVNFIGGRILQAREMDKLQDITRGVDDSNVLTAFDLDAVYRERRNAQRHARHHPRHKDHHADTHRQHQAHAGVRPRPLGDPACWRSAGDRSALAEVGVNSG
jgi:hypothetical protein